MKKKKKKAAFPAKAQATKVKRWLILVDDEPLRRKALAKRDRLLEKIQEARGWHEEFERKDKAAFAQWIAATFGPIMTQIRENFHLINEKQSIIEEVEDEMLRGTSRSYQAAYRKVVSRNANPPPEPERGPEPRRGTSSDDPPPGHRESSREERASQRAHEDEVLRLFRQFVKLMSGLSPEDLTPEEYKQAFTEFRDNILHGGRKQSIAARAAPSHKSVMARLKEIYRILVRRLHPDVRNDSSSQVATVWHEVQEAYQQGNLERLEVLLAVTDDGADAAPGQASLGQIHNLIAALERDLGALRRTLKSARQDPAWNFTKLTDRTVLEQNLRREIESELAAQKRSLREMEMQIQRWAQVPAQKRKSAPEVPRPMKAPKTSAQKSHTSPSQGEFGF